MGSHISLLDCIQTNPMSLRTPVTTRLITMKSQPNCFKVVVVVVVVFVFVVVVVVVIVVVVLVVVVFVVVVILNVDVAV